MKRCFIVLFAVLSVCSLACGADRGLRIRTNDGKEIPLYSNSYALVVGNGEYRHWDPLPGALRDVKEVAAALRANGFDVTLKTDLAKDAFEQTFRDFVAARGKDLTNRLLFYYAGHGHTERLANEEDLGYLVMIDAPTPQADATGFAARSVDMQWLITQAKRIQSAHVLFMFDSCFSGSILNLRSRVVPESIAESVRNPVRQFITAGGANEPVPDRSHFKQCFLDILQRRDKEPIGDGYLTGEELGYYLKTKVPEYIKTQHPQYGKIADPKLDKGDFVFDLSCSVPADQAEPTPEPGAGPAPLPRQPDSVLLRRTWTNSLGMEFVFVPGVEGLFSIWETRVGDFDAFVRGTGHDATRGMLSLREETASLEPLGSSWKDPGFAQGPTHPVVGVSWLDAQEFCRWLTAIERKSGMLAPGQFYRLPTDSEWSHAVGLTEEKGNSPAEKDGKVPGVYPWGSSPQPPERACNFAGEECKSGKWVLLAIAGYNDGYPRTAPAGSFIPNAYRVYDLAGNASEWCENRYDSGPNRVARGGSWFNSGEWMLSSKRAGLDPAGRTAGVGFRCVVSRGPTNRLTFAGCVWEPLSGEWRSDGTNLIGSCRTAGPFDAACLVLSAATLPRSWTISFEAESLSEWGWMGIGIGYRIIEGGKRWCRSGTSDAEGMAVNFAPAAGTFNAFKGEGGHWYHVNPAWKEWPKSSALAKKKNAFRCVCEDGKVSVTCNGAPLVDFTLDASCQGTVSFAVGRDNAEFRISNFRMTPAP